MRSPIGHNAASQQRGGDYETASFHGGGCGSSQKDASLVEGPTAATTNATTGADKHGSAGVASRKTKFKNKHKAAAGSTKIGSSSFERVVQSESHQSQSMMNGKLSADLKEVCKAPSEELSPAQPHQ